AATADTGPRSSVRHSCRTSVCGVLFAIEIRQHAALVQRGEYQQAVVDKSVCSGLRCERINATQRQLQRLAVTFTPAAFAAVPSVTAGLFAAPFIAAVDVPAGVGSEQQRCLQSVRTQSQQ